MINCIMLFQPHTPQFMDRKVFQHCQQLGFGMQDHTQWHVNKP